MPPHPRPARVEAVDEQAGDDRESGAGTLAILGGGVVGVEMAQAWRLARLGRDPHSPRPAPDRRAKSRSRRPGARRRSRAGRRRAPGDLGDPRRALGVFGSSSTTARPSRPTSCSSRVGRTPGPRGSASRHSESSPAAPRGRRRPARAGSRLAVRRRRRERPRPAHPHGQVPGPARRRHDSRPAGPAALGRRALAARDLHRPAGRGGRAHAGRRAGAGLASVTSMSTRAATPVDRSSATVRRAPHASSSTRTGASSSAPRSPDPSRRGLHAATIAVVAEVPLDDLWHAVPRFPTRSELWLRLLEAYGL